MKLSEAREQRPQDGRIGLTHEDSEPWYPEPLKTDGPDIVIVLLDDVGFADLGCYGSELHTPNFNALATGGHRYNNFHTTTLCSSSRACLLTGRNHHSVGMRMLSNVDSGWPSGRGRITRNAALIPEVLCDAGYNTFAVGKWHIAPMRETSPAGPFDEWPLKRGFNQFYGFMNGATDHFYPELVRDNHFIDPPGTPEDGYHLTDDLINQACQYVADHVAHRPASPFFLYLPLGAAHAPHHAPKEFLERVRGRYDGGWDLTRQQRFERQLAQGVIPPNTELPSGNPDVPAWDSLSPDEKRVATRLQEAYAAFLEHTDTGLGRLVDFLKQVGRWDNTLFIATSDNGAAMEGGRLGSFSRIGFFNGLEENLDKIIESIDDIGGPAADSHYPTGWAQASNTPLRWYKFHTHGGGVRDPLIVSWPERLSRPGDVLEQFHHIIDIAPTIYEVAGVEAPSEYNGVPQMPIHGSSLAYTFEDPEAPTCRSSQYFEMFGNRGIWVDGWKAVTHHTPGTEYNEEEWELYCLENDFSEACDLAEAQPKKLRQMVDVWWREAGRYGVLPLDDRSVELLTAPPPPGSSILRPRFDYFPPVSYVEPSVVPPLESAEWHTLEVETVGDKAGVLVAYGGRASGFVLYMNEGRVWYEYNAVDEVTVISADLPSTKAVRVLFEFQLVEGRKGRGRLVVNEQKGQWFVIPYWLPFLALSGMHIGRDSLSPISTEYEAPFEFLGRIVRVTIRLGQHDQELNDLTS